MNLGRVWQFKAFFSLALFLVASSLHAAPAGYKLAWSDEFDGLSLDTNRWTCYPFGKWNGGFNTPGAVSITNGCLVITTFTRGGTNFTDHLDTRGKFERTRGYWEARIRFDDSPGMWSAFWLQSTNNNGFPLGNPGKAGAEIDICEHRATGMNGENIGGKVNQAVHWDGKGKTKKSDGGMTRDLKLDSGFHLYGLEWTDSGYRFFVDDHLTWTTTNALSNTNEFIILSSTTANPGWGGKAPAAGYGDLGESKTRMIVDYVRYYSPP